MMEESSEAYQNVIRRSLKLKSSASLQQTRTLRKKRKMRNPRAHSNITQSHGSGSDEYQLPGNYNESYNKAEQTNNLLDDEFDANVVLNQEFQENFPEETVMSVKPDVIESQLLGDTTIPEERLTAAEKAFRLVQKKREKERIAKRLELTHRQRMEKFNSQLKRLPEHFDIPKVGPG